MKSVVEFHAIHVIHMIASAPLKIVCIITETFSEYI